MVVNLRIKLPDPSTLPEGYSLQAILVEPVGPLIPETYSGRKFRPEAIHLYYSKKPVNGSMYAGEHPEWIIVSEGYSLGSNSTEPYGQDNPLTGYKVGWFLGYPSYMRDKLVMSYQFEGNMGYTIYAAVLSQDQIFAMMKSLLLGHRISIRAQPETQYLTPRGSTSFIVYVRSIEDFGGPLKLEAGTPKGVTAEFQPSILDIPPFGEKSSVLTLKAAPDAPEGNSTISITVIDPRNSTRWKAPNVNLNILAAEVETITVTTTVTSIFTTLPRGPPSDIGNGPVVTTTFTTTQVSDITLPLTALVAGVTLIVVAAIMLRGRWHR